MGQRPRGGWGAVPEASAVKDPEQGEPFGEAGASGRLPSLALLATAATLNKDL